MMTGGDGTLTSIVAFAPREKTRVMLRAAFPRRRCRVVFTKSLADFADVFRKELVDAAVVDISTPHAETWNVAALAREFPSAPFFGLTPLRAADGPAVAQCADLEFADVLVEGVDDQCAREIVATRAFSTRFAEALRVPPAALALDMPVQQRAWEYIVSHAGRRVPTVNLAKRLGVTREHLSRTFAAQGAPNLKRIIDLVRLLAAAELSKNPGYDIRDVATVLDFASSSHLSSTAQRVVGTKPASLARLRAVDLIQRFCKGHGRSRS
ncbi:MAG TPA: AraC family transcriptional regulator [Gemmatimonadaceae bacterium]|nr:AraC family transcriptional regulator [Gemmatimonadaceae bacterium]